MIEVTRLSLQGDGIGQILLENGKYSNVYLPGACPGDIIEFDSLPDTKPYVISQYSIYKPSKYRVSPRCPHSKYCGGCSYQHIDYSEQISIKETQLSNIFDSFLDMDIIKFTASKDPYRYRNRITLQFRNGKAGFALKDNSDIFTFSECHVAEKTIETMGATVAQQEIIPNMYGVTIYRDNEEIQQHYLQKQTDNAEFLQVNDYINTKIIETIRFHMLTRTSPLSVLDLFCGNGNLSFPLLDIAENVIGVDISDHSISQANRKAKSLAADHYSFHTLSVFNAHSDITGFALQSNTLIVDPPRRGLGKDAAFVASLQLPFVIYLSCNPLSLKKDLESFLNEGYKINSITGFDMFPQTPHIETLCILEKNN